MSVNWQYIVLRKKNTSFVFLHDSWKNRPIWVKISYEIEIEAVQRRAARSVLNDWSHPNTQTPALKELQPYTVGSSSSVLQFGSWNSLEKCRGHYSLVMMYKIIHGMVVIPTTPYLLPASYDTRGHSSKFLVPSTRVNAFRYSYFPVTIMSWNGLPAHIIQSPSVECFKSRLAKFHLIPTST